MSSTMRYGLLDMLCTLGEEARARHARHMRALDIPTPWEDVVIAAISTVA